MTQIIQPSVALLMLSYNHEDCIENSVLNLLSQKYSNFQLYVFDDYSTDSTFDILQKIDSQDSRIVAVRNEQNLGMFINFGNSLRFLIENHNFEYFSWVSPDDEWSEDWLSSLILMDRTSEVGDVRQSSVIYRATEKSYTTKYSNFSRGKLGYSDSKILREGYGQIIHGIWKRNIAEKLMQDSELLNFTNYLKLENFLVAKLIDYGGFTSMDKLLHTKRKDLSSKKRYSNDRFFQNPNKILLVLIRTLPQTLKLIFKSRNPLFVFGGWLIDIRISLKIGTTNV